MDEIHVLKHLPSGRKRIWNLYINALWQQITKFIWSNKFLLGEGFNLLMKLANS
jgi:hypothetical protein